MRAFFIMVKIRKFGRKYPRRHFRIIADDKAEVAAGKFDRGMKMYVDWHPVYCFMLRLQCFGKGEYREIVEMLCDQFDEKGYESDEGFLWFSIQKGKAVAFLWRIYPFLKYRKPVVDLIFKLADTGGKDRYRMDKEFLKKHRADLKKQIYAEDRRITIEMRAEWRAKNKDS
jgi:hypothetical protein